MFRARPAASRLQPSEPHVGQVGMAGEILATEDTGMARTKYHGWLFVASF